MKKIFIFLLLINVNLNIFSQNHRFYTPFKLQNYHAIWQKVMIDSSIIGLINPFQQYDQSVYYDGFSHFYSYDIFKLDPIFYNDKIYLAELNQIIGDGAYIECIDELSCATKWKTVFDHRYDIRKEYPVHVYISDDGKYQILGHRNDFSRLTNLPGNMWFNSVFTTRKYETATGNLIERDTSDETSPNTCRMKIPFGASVLLNQLYSTYLIKNSEIFRYILPRSIDYKILDIDSKGFVKDSVFVNRIYDETIYRDRTYFISNDRMLNLRFARNINNTPEDSFHVYFTIYDDNLNELRHKDLKDDLIPAYDYACVFADDKGFIITGNNYEEVGDTMDFVLTANLFDIYGELKESVRLENKDGSPIFSSYPFATAISLDENGGMLISSNERDKDGYCNLVFYKTNGTGAFEKITKWKIEDKKHNVLPINMWKTPSEKILVKLVHANTDLNEFGYGNTAMVYMLIEPEDVGIKTSISEIAESMPIHIYPNPASGSISISCEDNDASMIEIIDRLGRVVYKDKTSVCEELSIDISGYTPGLYFVRLVEDSGKVTGRGKFVKE